MICKLSPFLFDFGGINNCFCNKDLSIFQEVFQYIFLREVQYWQGRNMGEGKPEFLWREVYHSTLASGFHSRIVFWLQRQRYYFQEDRKSWSLVLDPCLLDIFIHRIHCFRLLSSTVTCITFFQNQRMAHNS